MRTLGQAKPDPLENMRAQKIILLIDAEQFLITSWQTVDRTHIECFLADEDTNRSC